MMKASVIIPIYNVAPYIERCLESVTAQTYPDLECVLVDDCGTDDSMDIVERFIQEYRGRIQFTVVRHDKNGGLSAARNTGVRVATGDVVYFLDSDDAITADCISSLAALATKYPQAEMTMGNMVSGKEYLSPHRFTCEVPEFCDDKGELEKYVLERTIATSTNKLLKRTFLLEYSIFFPEGYVIEDRTWLYLLAKNLSAAAFTNAGTYLYYINNNSIMTNRSKTMALKRINGFKLFCNTVLTDLKNNPAAISSCKLQYLAGGILSYMMQLCASRSLRQWLVFWRMMFGTWWKLLKRSWYGNVFFVCSIPFLCFLAGVSGWRWRLRHNVIKKI